MPVKNRVVNGKTTVPREIIDGQASRSNAPRRHPFSAAGVPEVEPTQNSKSDLSI
jgi:hypothetical protein